MALPIPEKTWQFNVNQSPTSVASLAFAIKQSLVGFASNPWTVIGSSNSTTSGMDAVDRWVSAGNVVTATGAHSWIVLQQSQLNAKYQVCIDMNGTQTYRGSVIWSPVAGFGTANGGTNGSTTTRPTAVDEVVLLNNSDILSSDVASRLHAVQSTDGLVTRLLIARNGTVENYLAFERPKNPPTGWVMPSVAYAGVSVSGNFTYARWNEGLRYTGWNNSVLRSFTTTLTSEGYRGSATSNGIRALGNSQAGSSGNDLNGEWPLCPIAVFSETIGCRGRHGLLYDMWWGSAQAGQGDTYPGDGSNQFAQFGCFVFPWDGSAPSTA